MSKSITIFYSWQSDLNEKTNNFFIRDCIRNAIKKLNRGIKMDERIIIDHDTKNKSGSPNIVDTIFNKIEKSDIFICDVTIINKFKCFPFLQKRITPNPNVLLELGFAVNSLGWDRVICLNNISYNKIEDLPFDIKQNRISKYQSGNKDSKSNLENLIYNSIKSILDTDPPKKNNKEEKLVLHDLNLFKTIDTIIPEKQFFERVEKIGAIKRINMEQLDIFDLIINNSKLQGNKFLKKEIDLAYCKFIDTLEEFLSFTGTYMTPTDSQIDSTYTDTFGNKKPFLEFKFPEYKHPRDYDEWENKIEKQGYELVMLSIKVKESYSEFRKVIKENLFI